MAKKPVKKKKAKRGQPTRYNEKVKKHLISLAGKGFTDVQISDFIGVKKQTLNNWKKKYPDFFASLKSGKILADEKVEISLYDRACGYSHPEDKIFNNNGTPLIVPTTRHYPPDTTAAIFWLKNRQPGKWRDVKNLEHGIDAKVLEVLLNNLPPEIAEKLKQKLIELKG